MSATLRRSIAVLAWMLAGFGTLQIRHFDLNLGHGVCGPWGCGPEAEVLIANHGFWLVALLPPSWILASCLTSPIRFRVAVTLAVVGLTTLIGTVGWDLVQFFERQHYTEYWLQRILFQIATQVDLPAIPLTLGGLIMLLRRKQPQEQSAADTTDPRTEAATVPAQVTVQTR